MTTHDGSPGGRTLRELFSGIRVVTYEADAPPVVKTVAAGAAQDLAPGAAPRSVSPGEPPPRDARIHVGAGASPPGGRDDEPSLRLRLNGDGGCELWASHTRWLYALFCLVRDEWLDESVIERTVRPSFPLLRNLSDFLVGSLRNSRGFSREEYVRQVARMGFSHLTINSLGAGPAHESGPPGDVYSWFYDYSPDLDQFVDSSLLKGYYPAEYLKGNLERLKANAALALKYGLVPGLHINSPRSMPEEFWLRYPFLRGARVDHPRESFRPRYTLAMAHPAVQGHYRELARNILREVPGIGFIQVWTNDSGAGFEFVTSLYAGRNGGPYMIREWKSDDEIARTAAENILTYYRILHGEFARANPAFRLICDIASFYAERKYIVPVLGGGIDVGEFGSFAGGVSPPEQAVLDGVGAWTHRKAEFGDNNVPGVPFPGLVHERLRRALMEGERALLGSPSPGSLAPFDINGEVVRSFQFLPSRPLEEILARSARAWAGGENARALVEIWLLSDEAVRSFPAGVPLSTFAFPWFRLSVRPFVPNIDAIPEEERAYYERYLLATFNNPARIDLNNDMLWNFLSVEEALVKQRTIDTAVFPPLEGGIAACREMLFRLPPGTEGRAVFADVHDRLRAWRSFAMTLRNMLAWTASVHGYIRSRTREEKSRFRSRCREMISSETENAMSLLALWRESEIEFMPVAVPGETLHSYGTNFGELLENKIRLMELHADDEPYIDPDFMWRMPQMSPH
jgi:hypothetical protein